MFEHIDWNKVSREYWKSGDSHVVIDDFMTRQGAIRLQDELIRNQMWRLKNPISKHLHNTRPKTDMAVRVVEALETPIRRNFGRQYRLAEYWALLYAKNTDGNVHADFGDLTITYWLTPDRYNLDRETGGLVLYDARRPADMPFSAYLASGEASRAYVGEHARQAPVVIPYRFNRAILFNPSIFHKSNRPHFDLSHPSRMRMNMTFSFRDPEETRRQMEMVR
ncbi:MAG: hypothetical protein V6Z86_01745 [Hyphomicrobiales bacterium]